MAQRDYKAQANRSMGDSRAGKSSSYYQPTQTSQPQRYPQQLYQPYYTNQQYQPQYPQQGYEQQYPATGNSRISQQRSQSYLPPKQNIQQHLDEERLAVVRHLEKLIERERAAGIQIRESIEEEMQKIKIKNASNQQKIESFEQHLTSLQSEKNNLSSDQSKWENQIKEVLARKSTVSRQMTERLSSCQTGRNEMERKHQAEVTQLQQDLFNRLRELDQEWGQKCDQLMDSNRRIDEYNQDMSRKINEVRDDIHNFNQDSSSKTMDLVEKVKKTILTEFKEQLSVMESSINRIDEDRLKISRKNQETLTEAQKCIRKQTEELEYMIKDKVRLEIENQDASLKNKQFELYTSSVQLEVNNREKLRKRLEEQLDFLKVKNENVNKEDQDQLHQVTHVHKTDLARHEKDRDDLRKRSEALTNTIKDNDLDNARLYSDVNRLLELLQANATKAVYSTFTENKFI